MAEEKKRFPWWMAVCAVVLAILGTALGFIETVGRRGTLVGRWEAVREHDEMPEAELVRLLGPPLRMTPTPLPGAESLQTYAWEDGPASLAAFVYPGPVHEEARTATVELKFVDPYSLARDRHITWHMRRWAEQAYTAIHGPRR